MVAESGGSEARPVVRVAGIRIFSYALDDECMLDRNTSRSSHRVARSPERVTKGEVEPAAGSRLSQNTMCDLMNSAVMTSVLGSRGRRSVAWVGENKRVSRLNVKSAHLIH